MGGKNEQKSWFLPLKNEEKKLLNALITAQKAQGNMNQLQPLLVRTTMGIVDFYAYFDQRAKLHSRSRMRIGILDGQGLEEELKRESRRRSMFYKQLLMRLLVPLNRLCS